MRKIKIKQIVRAMKSIKPNMVTIKPNVVSGVTGNQLNYSTKAMGQSLKSVPPPAKKLPKTESEILIIKEIIVLACDLIKLNFSISIDRDSTQDEDSRCSEMTPYTDSSLLSAESKLLIRLENNQQNMQSIYNIHIDVGHIIITHIPTQRHHHPNASIVRKISLNNPKFEFSEIIESIVAHITISLEEKISKLNKQITETNTIMTTTGE